MKCCHGYVCSTYPWSRIFPWKEEVSTFYFMTWINFNLFFHFLAIFDHSSDFFLFNFQWFLWFFSSFSSIFIHFRQLLQNVQLFVMFSFFPFFIFVFFTHFLTFLVVFNQFFVLYPFYQIFTKFSKIFKDFFRNLGPFVLIDMNMS